MLLDICFIIASTALIKTNSDIIGFVLLDLPLIIGADIVFFLFWKKTPSGGGAEKKKNNGFMSLNAASNNNIGGV